MQDGDRVLLVDRPDHLGFPGYIGPGGKVGFPESIAEGAVRELWEETGLIVKPGDLIFKGIDESVLLTTNSRRLVFNYLAAPGARFDPKELSGGGGDLEDIGFCWVKESVGAHVNPRKPTQTHATHANPPKKIILIS